MAPVPAKHTPDLNFVRSFEAAARHLSFTAAAEELSYTQSAISNHVRSLENFIGKPLFIRHPRSLSLTELGEAYLPSVRSALSQIDTATEAILSSTHQRRVVVSCPISLAQNWLPSVIAEFTKIHPEISITVHGTIWNDVEADVADISLVSSRKSDAPTGSELLWPEMLVLVCSKEYLERSKPIRIPADIVGANLIHILGRSVYWESFAAKFALLTLDLTKGQQTNALNVALELAVNGQGFALVPQSLVGSYIERGLLVRPLEFELSGPWSCYVVALGRPLSKSAGLFHKFLREHHRPDLGN
jgi:LysR family transcriptional regulator, glycine cleavage system transcriptional activator